MTKPAGLVTRAFRRGWIVAWIVLVSLEADGRAQTSPVSVRDLKCEYSHNPIGIDSLHPRLSWVLSASQNAERQTAYEILVASSEKMLAENRADIWHTGKVTTDRSIQIPFQGKPVQSGTRYYWKVRIWDKEGRPSAFSEPGYWEMGLLARSDWKGVWIGYPAGWDGRALYFHDGFSLQKEVQSARVYVAGLGYYELHINGRRIGDHVLDPGVTNYAKRVLYSTYDVTDELKEGANAIGVIAGNGWYGEPKLLLQMNVKFTDHTQQSFFTSGKMDNTSSWQVTASPILRDSIYGGETYDGGLEKPGWDQAGAPIPPADRSEGWWLAIPVGAPGGALAAQEAEPIRVMQTLAPVAMTNPSPGIYVFDSGQNLAGWAQLRVQGAAGTRVTMKFAEVLNPDGTVDQRNLRTARATDEYILRGRGEEQWEPRFTYHGFRYIQLEGFPGVPTADNIRIRVVRSSLADAGSFLSSNALVNSIQKMVWWTEASNLYSIPTDCPQRDERMGWMNDLTVRLEESLYNFDGARFYSQFADDVEDSQGPDGAITDTVPWMIGGRPADPVDESYLLIGWLLYQNDGDTEIIRRHYASFKAWVDYLNRRAPDHLIDYGHYGDWSPPEAFSKPGGSALSKDTPLLFMSQGYYEYALRLLSKMAGVIGKPRDREHYSRLADQARRAMNARYWDEQKGGYGANGEASNSFGLFLATAPDGEEERITQNLEKNVEQQDWHLTTGNLTTKYLLEMLTEHGKADSAFRIATQTTYPSWGFMLQNGATTLWERWEMKNGSGMNSHNHPMMGSVSSYFYRYLAGINSDPSIPGFKHSIIHPYMVTGLDWVKATHQTMYGPVGVDWERRGKSVRLKVTIPVNTTATVFVPSAPDAEVRVNGKAASSVAGVHLLRPEKAAKVFAVESGAYNFSSFF